MPRSTRTPTGQFPPGVSGNPRGRPRRDSADPQTAIARAPAPTVTRRDGWRNSASGHGTARDRRILTQYGVDIVTDVEALQLRRSEFLAAAIIEQGPKDALRRGWHLKCEDKELVAAIGKQAEALGLTRILYEAWTKELEAGGAAIFPVLTGALGDLSTELDEGAIASVDAFHVFEPQELTPESYYTDVTNPKFRRPETYRLIPLTTGRAGWMPPTIIHETRLVIFPGQRHTVQTQPGQRMSWGDSVLCRPRQVIADFGLAWGSAATLLAGHGGGTLAMDGFTNMMGQADGLTQFDNYIASMEMAMSTLRMRVIDAKDTFTREASSLSGLAETLDKFATLIAAAARRPVSILMGRGETGLRTGDDDTRSWYATVEGDRSNDLKPRHLQILKLMLLATTGPAGGKEPETWDVEYPPLWSPSEKETADTRFVNMQRAALAIDKGVASADDVAESFYPEDGDGKGDLRGDIAIDYARREAQAEIDAMAADQVQKDRAAMQAMGYDQPAEGGSDAPESARTDAAAPARDYHGRFAAGHGAAHDAARVERTRAEATSIARASGHADHVARGEHEAAKEHAAIANEHRALGAGHVAPVPTAKLAAYEAEHGKAQERAAQIKATLDEHQGHAARLLATLRAHPEHDDLHDPTDTHEQASSQLGRVAGHHGETSYDTGHVEPTGSYREHAEAAQTALESLHGHQTRALADLKQVDREHERAAGGMQREAERHGEHGVRVPEDHPEHAAASAAADTLSGHETDRRGDIASEMRGKIEDAHDALREAARGTVQTVRELSKITGRAPKLAGK